MIGVSERVFARRVSQLCRSCRRQERRKRVGRRAGEHKNTEPVVAGSAKCCHWVDGYAAADFFTALVCFLAGGFGAAFFAAFAFSRSANSFFTAAAMDSTLMLYSLAASARTRLLS